MQSLPVLVKAPTAEQRRLQVLQWVQASSSITCRVWMLAGLDRSGSMTALAKRLTGVAIRWNILLKGR